MSNPRTFRSIGYSVLYTSTKYVTFSYLLVLLMLHEPSTMQEMVFDPDKAICEDRLHMFGHCVTHRVLEPLRSPLLVWPMQSTIF